MTSLTIIIPVFNETKTILKILERIEKIDIKKQIIIVDDGSNDGTKEKIKDIKNKDIIKLFHKKNLGKGAAIKSAQKYIKEEFVIIQDADLEYDPNDYIKLLKPFVDENVSVVYGSRVLNKNRYHLKNFTSLDRIFYNHLLTILSNIINNQNLTDSHTCYKIFRSTIFKSIRLDEKGFAFCPEITTKISKLKKKIIEVPIHYSGRSYKEGKKIKFKDGIEAVMALFKYKYFK